MAIRAALPEDIPAVVEVQRQSALLSLSHIFPQDHHPFSRELVGARWHAELADPSLYATRGGEVPGLIERLDKAKADFLHARGVEGGPDSVEEFASGTAPAATRLRLRHQASAMAQATLRVISSISASATSRDQRAGNGPGTCQGGTWRTRRKRERSGGRSGPVQGRRSPQEALSWEPVGKKT